MTYTSTGTDWDDQASCSWIVFLCTAESFVGLLYAGMCAAILFGKIGRIQSHAQITFSDAICIQYKYEPNEDGQSPGTPMDSPEQPVRQTTIEFDEGSTTGTAVSPSPQSPAPTSIATESLFSPYVSVTGNLALSLLFVSMHISDKYHDNFWCF